MVTKVYACVENFPDFTQYFDDFAYFFYSNPFVSILLSKQKLSNNLSLNFLYLKIIRFLHPRYQPKIIEDILKNAQKTTGSALMMLYDYVMTLKMRLKIKNRPQNMT